MINKLIFNNLYSAYTLYIHGSIFKCILIDMYNLCNLQTNFSEEIEVLCRQIGLRRRRPVGYELGLTDFAIDPICPGCVQMHPCHRQKLLSSTNYFKRVILQVKG